MDEPTGQIIEAGPDDADTALILLHGLGADGNDLAPLATHLAGPDRARWRFLFPDAPLRTVAMAGGMRVRAWYDIDPGAAGAAPGLSDSVARAQELIEREIARGVPAERIVIGGFSQGGVIALDSFLASEHRLAGAVGLSTYLHDHAAAAERCGLANAAGRIFLAHGQADGMIPLARAATGRTTLESLGFEVRWHQYPMGHEICMDELRDLSAWLDALPGLAGAASRS
ncbi:MAG: carboxylesterase [Pseudomonadales bacterium]|jgi:phospholipase/carboxylesterase|nr:carboxylesterase [Pseudomonadales bacterium]